MAFYQDFVMGAEETELVWERRRGGRHWLLGPEKNLRQERSYESGVASILTECKRANVRRFIMQKRYQLERWTRAPLSQPLCHPRIDPDIHCCNLLTRRSPSG
jgi:hypothetical protein